MQVILIGFMGSGKTTVSPLLSEQLNLPVTDLDQAIIDHSQMSISEIFQRHGEVGFRQIEHQVLIDTLQNKDGILATGGGTPLRADNRLKLEEDAAPVILLHASPEETARRIHGSTDRPIANQLDTAGLGKLLAQRQARYEECADVTIDTDGRSPQSIADEIKSIMNHSPLN